MKKASLILALLLAAAFLLAGCPKKGGMYGGQPPAPTQEARA